MFIHNFFFINTLLFHFCYYKWPNSIMHKGWKKKSVQGSFFEIVFASQFRQAEKTYCAQKLIKRLLQGFKRCLSLSDWRQTLPLFLSLSQKNRERLLTLPWGSSLTSMQGQMSFLSSMLFVFAARVDCVGLCWCFCRRVSGAGLCKTGRGKLHRRWGRAGVF